MLEILTDDKDEIEISQEIIIDDSIIVPSGATIEVVPAETEETS
jgi:hypothetical protein